MHESSGNEDARRRSDDPLAELIRAAGRRASPPREHYDTVYAAAREAWRDKLGARRSRRISYALAASVAIIAGAAMLAQLLIPVTPQRVAVTQTILGDLAAFSPVSGAWEPVADEGTTVQTGTVLRTALGSGAALELPAGTSVRIDADSQIRMTGPDTVELLAGAVYVDSGGNPAAGALTIMTRYGLVRDIGTQFEVRESANGLRVRVRSGRVELAQSDAEPTLTIAGEQLEVSDSGTVERREFPPSHGDWDWVQRLATAPANDHRSILTYLQWIANESGRELRFDSPNTELLAELTEFEGDPEGFTPQEVLESIELTSGFTYLLLGDDTILMTRK
jgi:hypothetical protein